MECRYLVSLYGNVLSQQSSRAVWILLAAGGPRSSEAIPTPFSRTIPRVIGPAWFRRQDGTGPLLRIRGAWGARLFTWIPLTGNLANLQPLIDNFNRLLIELGDPDQAGGTTMPRLGQPYIPMPRFVPALGRVGVFMPGLGQAQPAQSRVGMNQTATTSLDTARVTELAEGSRRPIGAAEGAADAISENTSMSTISNDVDVSDLDNVTTSLVGDPHGENEPSGSAPSPPVPIWSREAQQLLPSPDSHAPSSQSPAPNLSEPSQTSNDTSNDKGSRPSKRPRPDT